MNHANEILNILLDRYQRSGHCIPGQTSTRRVALSFKRGEYQSYRTNDPCVSEINDVVDRLSQEKLISYSWQKGYEQWLIDKVWLNLDMLENAYKMTGRTPPGESSAMLCELLEQSKKRLATPWKLKFIDNELTHIRKKLKQTRLLSGDKEHVKALLTVLEYTEQGPELMRVISVNCFNDSKYLENFLVSQLVSIAKAYEPELVANKEAGDKRLTRNVVLEQIGILTYPEIIEFSGNIELCFSEGNCIINTFKKGFCLQSENISNIQSVKMSEIKRILFIENRTNYLSIIRQSIDRDMLIVWHGGFYSPTKRKFFKMLNCGMSDSTGVLFWGDIDLGGFLMYMRLKNDIFPNLTPWKMSLNEYNLYKEHGVKCSPEYLEILSKRMSGNLICDEFVDVAKAIVEYGVTVEQEAML